MTAAVSATAAGMTGFECDQRDHGAYSFDPNAPDFASYSADASGCVTLIAGPTTPAPPQAISGGPWKWASDPKNSRGGVFVGEDGATASWDKKDQHWDVDYRRADGHTVRERFNRFGAPLSAQQAHGNVAGPKRFPLPPRAVSPFCVFPFEEKMLREMQSGQHVRA